MNRIEAKQVSAYPGINLHTLLNPDVVDEKGRPLYELSSGTSIVTRQKQLGVPFEITESHHGGSRQSPIEPGKPRVMNQSAFEAIKTTFGETQNTLSFIAEQYYVVAGIPKPERMNAVEFAEICGLLKYLPLYYWYEAGGYYDQKKPLPSLLANVFKIAAGMSAVSREYISRNDPFKPTDPSEIIECAEILSMFNSGERTCPAPPGMIRSTIQAITEKKTTSKPSVFQEQIPFENIGRFGTLIMDFEDKRTILPRELIKYAAVTSRDLNDVFTQAATQLHPLFLKTQDGINKTLKRSTHTPNPLTLNHVLRIIIPHAN